MFQKLPRSFITLDPLNHIRTIQNFRFAWSIISVLVGVVYLWVYTIPYFMQLRQSLLLAVVVYGFRILVMMAIAVWGLIGIPWRTMQAHEYRQGRLISIICVLLIVLQVGLISNIIFDNTPYSFVQKVIYNMSIIVLLVQTLIFVQHGLVKYAGSLFLFGFIAEIFGSAGIIYGERQALVPFMYVLSVLIASLLVRWWVGLALVPILAPFGTAMQILGLAPGVPQWTTINIYIVYLGVIAALAALYAQSLESAISKLETESAAREHEAAERARAEAYAVQAEQLATERERTRIAAELHDSINYYLATIAQKLTRAQKHLTTNLTVANTEILETRGLTKFALADARASIHAMRSGSIQPLEQTIKELGDSSINVRVVVTGTQQYLPPEVALAGYRIAQETIANTLKHAQGATSITFTLDYQLHGLILTSEDDGHPQGMPADADHTKMGLIGLNNRVEQLGGTLVFGPGATGFRVRAEIPTESMHASNARLDC